VSATTTLAALARPRAQSTAWVIFAVWDFWGVTMTRDELIQAVRSQTDLDEGDLPEDLIETYLLEAFQRTAALERHWPSHQAEWEYQINGTGFANLDPQTAEISSVYFKDNGARLQFADHELVRTVTDFYGPRFFSTWGGKIYVWPVPEEETTFVVSGFRRPSSGWLNQPSSQVDLDERLHISLFHYAVALAYAQQEDPELESAYMRRWEMLTRAIREDIMKGGVYRPMILNGGMNY
jgi:hypothetical protein